MPADDAEWVMVKHHISFYLCFSASPRCALYCWLNHLAFSLVQEIRKLETVSTSVTTHPPATSSVTISYRRCSCGRQTIKNVCLTAELWCLECSLTAVMKVRDSVEVKFMFWFQSQAVWHLEGLTEDVAQNCKNVSHCSNIFKNHITAAQKITRQLLIK